MSPQEASDRPHARQPLSPRKLLVQWGADVLAVGRHARAACIAVLDVASSERMARARPSPELVWTGPDSHGSTARDTGAAVIDPARQTRRRGRRAGPRVERE